MTTGEFAGHNKNPFCEEMAQKARLTGEAGRRCLLRKITKRYQYTLGKQACQEGSGGEMISGIYFFSKQ